MVLKFFPNLKNYNRGITLVEIIVAVFIISLFSMIIISDFPKIQRQFALSRAAYQLAQDLRKTQDLGLSGLQTTDIHGSPISVKGYGIFINLIQSKEQYVIYADVDGDQKYNGDLSYPPCDQENQTSSPLASDCVTEIVDISKDSPSLQINGLQNINTGYDTGFTSINFSPPDPTINIENRCELCSDNSEIGIVLGLNSDSSAERTVWINTSGLIRVQ